MLQQITNPKVRARLMKQQDMRARNMLKKTFSVYVLDHTTDAQLYDSAGDRVRIGQTMAHALNSHSCHWSISLVIAVKESNCKNKLIIHDTDSPIQCKFSALIGNVADTLIEWTHEYPYQDNIITVGWVAAYKGNEIDEDMLYKIYDELGVWS